MDREHEPSLPKFIVLDAGLCIVGGLNEWFEFTFVKFFQSQQTESNTTATTGTKSAASDEGQDDDGNNNYYCDERMLIIRKCTTI